MLSGEELLFNIRRARLGDVIEAISTKAITTVCGLYSWQVSCTGLTLQSHVCLNCIVDRLMPQGGIARLRQAANLLVLEVLVDLVA